MWGIGSLAETSRQKDIEEHKSEIRFQGDDCPIDKETSPVQNMKTKVRQTEDAGKLVASGILTNLTVEEIGSGAEAIFSLSAKVGEQAMEMNADQRECIDEKTFEATDLQSLFEANQKRFDLNGNGKITKRELDKVIADDKVRGDDAILAAIMRYEFFQMRGLSDDQWFTDRSITAKDMAKLDELAQTASKDRSDEANDLIESIDEKLKEYRDITKNTNRKLYATDDPLKSIVPEAIDQQDIGDCYFLAPLASVAATDPQVIKEMIEDNADGTYTVTFPVYPNKHITVSAPTDAELLRFNAGGEHGIWASVIEKAFGKLLGGVNAQGADGGGPTGRVLSMFSDGSVDSDCVGRTSEDELHHDMKKAFKEGRAVVCGTSEDYRRGKPLKGDRIAAQHAYSVIDYDAETYTVTIRNPWANTEPETDKGDVKDGKDDGIFKMSLREFKATFEDVHYLG